jgi:hypothetical protein
MHDIPFLYIACIIFCLVKAPLIFVVTCCSGHSLFKNVMNCVKLSYVCDVITCSLLSFLHT